MADDRVVSVAITADASELVLSFSEPVSEEVAEEAADDLAEPGDEVEITTVAEQRTRWVTSAPLRRAEPPLSCGNQRVSTDSNGRFTLDYRRDLTPKRLPWSYRLSTAVQSIVVGYVTEAGLRWWKNGAAMPQNSPHLEPAWYQFHGTMNPAPIGRSIQFQDLMTFRHNVGSGGTASVTFASSVLTTRALP